MRNHDCQLNTNKVEYSIVDHLSTHIITEKHMHTHTHAHFLLSHLNFVTLVFITNHHYSYIHFSDLQCIWHATSCTDTVVYCLPLNYAYFILLLFPPKPDQELLVLQPSDNPLNFYSLPTPTRPKTLSPPAIR